MANPSQNSNPLPQGLTYFPAFITAEDAASILQNVDACPWMHDLKRRVQHYGYRYDYRARRASKDDYIGPLPDWSKTISERLLADGFFNTNPDQVIINEYQPGQGIAPHVDCVPCFGDTIASLSLGSTCEMEFRHLLSGDQVNIVLEPNSLLVLTGPARGNWSHCIRPRKSDLINGQRITRQRRISLTFRTMVLSGLQ